MTGPPPRNRDSKCPNCNQPGRRLSDPLTYACDSPLDECRVLIYQRAPDQKPAPELIEYQAEPIETGIPP